MNVMTLNTVNTNTSMWPGWAGKRPYNLPRVQFRVIFLNALQISPFRVGVSSGYVNTTVYYHSPTLHPPLLHHRYWSPFVSLCVIAVCDSCLSTHQIKLVIERHRTQAVLWKQRVNKLENSIQYIYTSIFFSFSHTWTRAYCNDTPLIDVWPVNLDFFIGAAPSVPIVASSHIDFISCYTGSGISYTWRVNRG